MSDLELLIVAAVVGTALATLGVLAAANFKNIAGRYTRSMIDRYDPLAERPYDSWLYKSQFWSMRVIGVVVAFMGLCTFVGACIALVLRGLR